MLTVPRSAVAIPFLVSGNSVEQDRGKFHLSRKWKGCVDLLEGEQIIDKKIYLWKLDNDSNKLEMIYHDYKNDFAEKIQSLRKSSQGTYGHSSKLILKLERSGKEETLDRPTMLFNYTAGSGSDEQNLLFPDKQCTLFKNGENDYTFACESTAWTVIKKKFSLI